MEVMGVLRLPTATATRGALGLGTLNSTLHSLVLVQTENARQGPPPRTLPCPRLACPPGEGTRTALRTKQPAQGTLSRSVSLRSRT